MNRRRFLRGAAVASGAALLRFPGLRSAAPGPAKTKSKRVLVLGGTNFLGPAVVRAAVVAGYEVALFNRGLTHPEFFPGLEKLRGLRSPAGSEENWTALGSRTWDVVIDVWPSDPLLAETAARRLRDGASHYLYVSSTAAYRKSGFAQPGLTEEAPTNPWDPSIRPYDRGKAESERRLQSLLGERLTVVRPGPIKGERDDTSDLLAWLRRCQAGGRHIGPGSGEDHVQFVDVHDVARFLILAIDRRLFGTYNLTGAPMTFREYLGRCNDAVRGSAEFVWIPQDFLHALGLDPAPWNDPKVPHYLGKFPSWHPEPDRIGVSQISSRKAFDAGWTQRPFAETALDYLWTNDPRNGGEPWTDELAPEVEARVLDLWSRTAAARG